MKYSKFIAVILIIAISFSMAAFKDNKPVKMTFNYLEQLVLKLSNYNKTLPEDKVYVQTDKPMYNPGETIWFNAFIRDGATLKPSQQSGIVYAELRNPKGAIVKSLNLIAKDGSAPGDFTIEEAWPGGIYTVKAWTAWQKNETTPAFFEKEIQVQKSILPRLKMKLDFQKEAYGNKDQVNAALSLNTNSNSPLSNYEFSYTASLNGATLFTQNSTTDNSGNAVVSFRLPDDLVSNDGLLNVMISYQGMTESISRSIPIILNNVELTFYPEGGDLVSGLPSKVAFKALNEYGKPADISGVVLDSWGAEVASLESFHQGYGAFEFKPQSGQKYKVKITKPEGVTAAFELPEAMNKGYGIAITSKGDDRLKLSIKSTQPEEMGVMVNVRGVNYFNRKISCFNTFSTLDVPLHELPMGIAHITLFDSKGIARAERLTYVNPDRQLKVKLSTNKQKYLPREKVQLTVETTDERGVPVPANLSLAVADDQLLTFADDKSSNILSWVLMESDIKGKVHEPNFYFNPEKEKATVAMDYLLMTEGWRRFTWKEIDNNNPVANIAGESTDIRGVVRDSKGNLLRNAVVEVVGTDIKQKTNAEGEFVIKDLELYESKQLLIKNQNGRETNMITISAYNNNELSIKTQNFLIGQVRNENGPIPYANVYAIGTNSGTTTDFEGNYKLLLPEGAEKVAVSYVGYNSQEAKVKGGDKLNFVLTESSANLEEVVASSFNRNVKSVTATTAGVARPRRPRAKNNRARNEVARSMQEERIRPMAAEMAPPPPPPMVMEAEEEAMNDAPADDDGIEFGAVEMKAEKQQIAVGRAKAKKRRAEAPMKEQAKAQKIEVEDKFDMANMGDEILAFEPAMVADRIAGKPMPPVKIYYRARSFAGPEYANKQMPAQRTDFRSTIYWNNRVETGRTGKTTVEFYNSDMISSFNITAEGFGQDGSIGRTESKFYTQLPFSIQTKIPVELAREDVVKLPATFVNNTSESLTGNLDLVIPDGLQKIGNWPSTLTIAPNSSVTKHFEFTVSEKSTSNNFAVGFESEGFSDRIEQKVRVVNRGFPAATSFSGNALNKEFLIDVTTPVQGTVEASFTAFPNTLSEVLSGLESMFRSPSGCFEQTSSSTYPNILVLNYMEETGVVKPEIAKKARGYIKQGYSRLTSFESKSGGFEWFGGDPGHEGLTAYGLMEFIDMKAVYSGVDDKMLKRTTDWLLKRRDGNGEFERNPRALHTFGLTDNATMSAYITWALTEGKIKGLDKEVNAAYKTAMKTKNPYQLGLAANILYNVNDNKRANEVLRQLIASQNEKGNWETDNKIKSAPGSGGNAYVIETASLALMAMLKSDEPNMAVAGKISNFLASSRGGYGGFGNTNSTVLALKGLIEFAKASKRTDSPGAIELIVNGNSIGTKSYKAGQQDPIVFEGLERELATGKNDVKVQFKNTKQALPYTMNVNWRTKQPNNSKECVLNLATTLNANTAKVGETVRLTTTIQNKTNEGHSTPIAIVGIPAGLSAQPWQLKELQEKGVYDFYEIKDNRVVFYYRQIAPNEQKVVPLDLKVEIPGSFEAEASSAYLYYTNEFKDWDNIGVVNITN